MYGVLRTSLMEESPRCYWAGVVSLADPLRPTRLAARRDFPVRTEGALILLELYLLARSYIILPCHLHSRPCLAPNCTAPHHSLWPAALTIPHKRFYFPGQLRIHVELVSCPYYFHIKHRGLFGLNKVSWTAPGGSTLGSLPTPRRRSFAECSTRC